MGEGEAQGQADVRKIEEPGLWGEVVSLQGAWWRLPGHCVKTDDLWAALAGGQGCGP